MADSHSLLEMNCGHDTFLLIAGVVVTLEMIAFFTTIISINLHFSFLLFLSFHPLFDFPLHLHMSALISHSSVLYRKGGTRGAKK